MKKITKFISLSIIASVIISFNTTEAATITSVTSGNWYATTTWDCACVPSDTDDVVIAALLTVTLTDVGFAKSVVINATGILSIADGTDILNVTTDVMNSGTCSTGGTIVVGNNFNNSGTLSGAGVGAVCIANVSTNSGSMVGSLDFCDATPPPNAPFIDNTTGGSIGTGITYCSSGICTGMSIAETNASISMVVYPNPAQRFVRVKVETLLNERLTLVLYDLLGQVVREIKGNSNEEITVDRNQLSEGMYFVSVQRDGQVIGSAKILFE